MPSRNAGVHWEYVTRSSVTEEWSVMMPKAIQLFANEQSLGPISDTKRSTPTGILPIGPAPRLCDPLPAVGGSHRRMEGEA